jgi:hypothetical protein
MIASVHGKSKKNIMGTARGKEELYGFSHRLSTGKNGTGAAVAAHSG